MALAGRLVSGRSGLLTFCRQISPSLSVRNASGDSIKKREQAEEVRLCCAEIPATVRDHDKYLTIFLVAGCTLQEGTPILCHLSCILPAGAFSNIISSLQARGGSYAARTVGQGQKVSRRSESASKNRCCILCAERWVQFQSDKRQHVSPTEAGHEAW